MANDGNDVQPTPQTESIPSPQISGEQEGQSLSQAGGQSVDFSVLEKDPAFNEFVEKVVQSKQDSRLGKYGTRLDSLEGAVAKYDALIQSGMSKEQAVDRMKLDQEIADIKAFRQGLESNAPSQASAGTGERPWTERRASILKEADIAPDDRRHVDMLKNNTYANHDEYVKDLEAKAFQWAQDDVKKPQPSPTTIAQTAQGLPVGDGTYTKEKYKNDMLAATGNKAELKRIKDAARADGVDVDRIAFT